MKEINNHLLIHWSYDGFLFNLRQRIFNKDKGEDLLKKLENIDISDEQHLNKRFVSLVWMIPLFLEWRLKDFKDNNILNEQEFFDKKKICRDISNEVERILGYPQ